MAPTCSGAKTSTRAKKNHDVIVVMTQRPATVQRIIPVAREDRDRASPAYGRKLAETLECLGVKSENEES